MTTPEVVVTGIGIVTALGSDMPSNWTRLLSGANGIKPLVPALSNEWVSIAAQAVTVDLASLGVHRRLRSSLPRVSQLSLHAGLSALRDAGLTYPDDVRRHDVAVVMGVGAPPDAHAEVPLQRRNPKWFLETYPNVTLGYLSQAAGITGFGTTIVSACTSGTHALGMALQLIRSRRAQVVLAGGADCKLQPAVFSGFRELHMCTACGDPDTAMRPFDRDRSGFVIGEGACFLVLEDRRCADARGATQHCVLAGYGASMNSSSVVDASHVGIAKSILAALADARVRCDQVGYINAHGTSTLSNDREEALAIKSILGDYARHVPTNSTKSMLGHTFAACGAIEAAVCVQSLTQQVVHPTRNFVRGDPDCDLDIVAGHARPARIEHAINNTSGVGGTNATLVFSKLN